MHILLLFSSVFLYPANTPSNPTLPEAEDEGSERSDGKYELFDQVDKQIKEGIKSLIDNCRLIFTTCLFSTNYYTTVNKLKNFIVERYEWAALSRFAGCWSNGHGIVLYPFVTEFL